MHPIEALHKPRRGRDPHTLLDTTATTASGVRTRYAELRRSSSDYRARRPHGPVPRAYFRTHQARAASTWCGCCSDCPERPGLAREQTFKNALSEPPGSGNSAASIAAQGYRVINPLYLTILGHRDLTPPRNRFTCGGRRSTRGSPSRSRQSGAWYHRTTPTLAGWRSMTDQLDRRCRGSPQHPRPSPAYRITARRPS